MDWYHEWREERRAKALIRAENRADRAKRTIDYYMQRRAITQSVAAHRRAYHPQPPYQPHRVMPHPQPPRAPVWISGEITR